MPTQKIDLGQWLGGGIRCNVVPFTWRTVMKNEHTHILANRMRSATSAAKRKILMQQAVNFEATDQKGQPLKEGDKVKTKDGRGVINSLLGRQSCWVTYESGKYKGQTIGVPTDECIKIGNQMQADVSMAVSREDQEQAADVARRANQQKAVIKYANMISRISLDIGTAIQNDDTRSAQRSMSNLKSWVTVLQSMLNDLD